MTTMARDVSFSQTYAAERDALLEFLTVSLQNVPDVQAVWLEGSFGRDTPDALSDLDIGIVLNDDRLPEVIADPGGFVRDLVGTTLEIRSPSIAPPNGAFLLTWVSWGASHIPFQVDWYWYPLSCASRSQTTRMLVDRSLAPIPVEADSVLSDSERDEEVARALRLALSMSVITAKRIARENPWVVASHLSSLNQRRLTAEWVLEHGRHPSYTTLRDLRYSCDVPSSRADQIELLWFELENVAAVIADANLAETFDEALSCARRYIKGLLGPDDTDQRGSAS